MTAYGLPQNVIDRVVERRGTLHAWESFEAARTALVVIDMQPYFLEEGAPVECADGRDLCPAINGLAEALRRAGGTVVWVRTEATPESRIEWKNFADAYGTEASAQRWELLAPGHEQARLWPALKPADGDWHIVKTRYSAFHPESSPLTDKLRRGEIDTVLIAGVATNVCCETSARDAMMYGLRTIMLADGNAASSRASHLAALANVMIFFGDVRTCEEIVERLQD